MKFTAKTEKQLNDERLIPDKTVCDYEVVNALDTKSKKSGADMIELHLKVYHGEGFVLMRDWIMEAMAHKLLHFCEASNLMKPYAAGTLCAADCVGAAGKLRVKVDPEGDFPAKNSVKDYIGTKEAEKLAAKVATPADATPEDDDVPF